MENEIFPVDSRITTTLELQRYRSLYAMDKKLRICFVPLKVSQDGVHLKQCNGSFHFLLSKRISVYCRD